MVDKFVSDDEVLSHGHLIGEWACFGCSARGRDEDLAREHSKETGHRIVICAGADTGHSHYTAGVWEPTPRTYDAWDVGL